MNIYFIRHGETADNRRHIHQGPDVPLSEHGRMQIGMAAEALKQFPITRLFTSDLLRTRESAGIIAPVLGLAPEVNPLFAEVRRPSVLYGHYHYTPKTAFVGLDMMAHLHDRNWHYSDEENLFDIKERVAKAVDFLTEVGKTDEHVAVVSHAFILNLFIKYMCAYQEVRVRDYLMTLVNAKRLKNGSITMVTYNDDNDPLTCDWLALNINDVAHLQ